MSNFELDIVIGVRSSARAVKVPLQRFTLIATSVLGEEVKPSLRSNFGILHRFEPYGASEIVELVERAARLLSIQIEPPAAAVIAERSRGIPRNALLLLRRLRDFADVRSGGIITADVATAAAEFINLDVTTTELRVSSPRREVISDEAQMFVWRRDGGACVKCGSRTRLEFDHIIPVVEGGSSTARNLQLLCEACNRRKGATI